MCDVDEATGEAGALLLDLIGKTARLCVLLNELPAEDFRGIGNRLGTYLTMFQSIPQEPRQGPERVRVMGFAGPTKPRRRK